MHSLLLPVRILTTGIIRFILLFQASDLDSKMQTCFPNKTLDQRVIIDFSHCFLFKWSISDSRKHREGICTIQTMASVVLCLCLLQALALGLSVSEEVCIQFQQGIRMSDAYIKNWSTLARYTWPLLTLSGACSCDAAPCLGTWSGFSPSAPPNSPPSTSPRHAIHEVNDPKNESSPPASSAPSSFSLTAWKFPRRSECSEER